MNIAAVVPAAANVASRAARIVGLLGLAVPAAGPDDHGYLNRRLLKLIALARVIVVLMGLLAVGLAMKHGIALPAHSLAGMAAAMLLISWTGIVHSGHRAHPTQGHLLLEIAFDIALLTVVLSLVGRDTPFDYLYMIPLVFAACAFTGWRVALVAAMVAIGWMTVHAFEENSRDAYASAVSAHLAIAALVSYFAFAVARLARRHERLLSRHREHAITALGAEAEGMVATRAAHALSTPLGTMAVIVADLRERRIPEEERDAALEILTRQIADCKLQLSGLLQSAGVGRGEGAYRADLLEILNEIREECLLHYPCGSVEILGADAPGEPRETLMELSLFNALAGIVKDFVREPPHVAEISTARDAYGVMMQIRRATGAAAALHTNPRRQERLAVLAAILERHAGALATGPGERIVVRLPYADATSTNTQ